LCYTLLTGSARTTEGFCMVDLNVKRRAAWKEKLRRLTSGRVRTWLTRAGASWMSLRARVAPHSDSFKTAERSRLAAHGFAVSVVAGAVLLRWMLGTSPDEPQFWLFYVAIVLSAAYGETAAALVATLLSVLLARVGSAVPLSTALLFGLEGLLIALVVLRMSRAIRDLRRSLATLCNSTRELKSAERQARRVDCALSRLEQASEDTALILLDQSGHVSDWRAGATRVYGIESSEMVGRSAATLFDEPGEADVSRLLSEARRASTRHTCRQLRAKGTTFAAEIEISPLGSGGLDGFTMIVRDLTHQQARAAADCSTAEAQAQLRAEVELAQQQLSTLQDLVDPTLNSLADLQIITALVDRLRTAINAEGIALIHLGRLPRHLCCASSGLQCQLLNHRPVVNVTDTARTWMIHNDPSGVAEVSAAVWPNEVSSLIAVPVVRAGSKQAVLEVVNRTGRRATEWEIALVQVVAARIAGFLEDESHTDSGANTWTASTSPSISHTGSPADLRLSLGEHISDQR
jgi:PAS domain S-box-containing protein